MKDDLETFVGAAGRERQDALEALMLSPGWLLFKDEARKQWGPEGYGRKVSQAIATHTGTVELAPAVEKVHATMLEINALVGWPDDEVKKLKLRAETTRELTLHRVPR